MDALTTGTLRKGSVTLPRAQCSNAADSFRVTFTDPDLLATVATHLNLWLPKSHPSDSKSFLIGSVLASEVPTRDRACSVTLLPNWPNRLKPPDLQPSHLPTRTYTRQLCICKSCDRILEEDAVWASVYAATNTSTFVEVLSDPSTRLHRSHRHLSDVIASKLRCSKSFFLLKRGTCNDSSSVKAGGTLGRGVLRSPSAGN